MEHLDDEKVFIVAVNGFACPFKCSGLPELRRRRVRSAQMETEAHVCPSVRESGDCTGHLAWALGDSSRALAQECRLSGHWTVLSICVSHATDRGILLEESVCPPVCKRDKIAPPLCKVLVERQCPE